MAVGGRWWLGNAVLVSERRWWFWRCFVTQGQFLNTDPTKLSALMQVVSAVWEDADSIEFAECSGQHAGYDWTVAAVLAAAVIFTSRCVHFIQVA